MPAPESIVNDSNVAVNMGYAQSKYVAERVLGIANQRSGVPVTILRIGQIAGPVKSPGIWPEKEWFPSSMKTSIPTGTLPSTLPDIDWIPIDLLSSIIVEVMHNILASNVNVLNLVNPSPIEWSHFLPLIAKRYSNKLRTVYLPEWITTLRKLASPSREEIDEKPALLIFDFFEILAAQQAYPNKGAYETSSLMRLSETSAGLRPVSETWMETWLDQWHE